MFSDVDSLHNFDEIVVRRRYRGGEASRRHFVGMVMAIRKLPNMATASKGKLTA